MRQRSFSFSLAAGIIAIVAVVAACSVPNRTTGAVGRPCAGHSTCASNLCVDVGGGVPLCSRICTDESVCPTGWACSPFGGIEGNLCQCIVRSERCNGLDDDCDGVVDNRCVGDGGSTECECQPSQSQEDQRPCSAGNETRTRMCDGCRWRAWTEWGNCAAGGCGAAQRRCNGACTNCPTSGVVQTGCAAAVCVALECQTGLQPCASGCCAMRIVDVDDGGLYAHMAMDSSGRVHIVHHQAGVGARYALERADGTFELRTVESGADLGVHASIALDGSDAPHIAYRNARVNTLRYARWTGGAFTAVQIDGTVQRGDVGWYVDVAMDAMDRPAFAYRNNKLSQLSYAFRSGSSSSYTLRDTTPASGQSVGEYPSMVIDDNGVAHIVHRNRSNNSLVYTSYRSGSFAHEVIDRNDNPGLDSQIGIMPNGDLVVAYYAYAAGVPRIARRVGSTWQVADIATGGRDLGIALGMAIDDDAALHLCLRDYDARTLYYAHVSASGDTQVRLVDGESDRGDFCSIAVADDGQVAIAYADRTRGKLMLARF